jgi:hypothetical protein
MMKPFQVVGIGGIGATHPLAIYRLLVARGPEGMAAGR